MYLDFNRGWDAVACDYYLIDDDEEVIGRNSCLETPIACGIMFRACCLKDIGMYNEDFRVHEDKELQIRFSRKYTLRHIELPLYRYRQHTGSLSRDLPESTKYNRMLQRRKLLDSKCYRKEEASEPIGLQSSENKRVILARERVIREKKYKESSHADHCRDRTES